MAGGWELIKEVGKVMGSKWIGLHIKGNSGGFHLLSLEIMYVVNVGGYF